MIAECPVEAREVQPYAAELALVRDLLGSDAWQKLDALDDLIQSVPQDVPPLNHIFTATKFPGIVLYTREGFIAKGHIVTSRIHLTEHPFVISTGVVAIWDDGEWKVASAPFTGVTKAGTRRVLYAIEDTIFSTFHVTDKTDPDTVALEITYSEGRFADLGIAAALKQPAEIAPHD